MTTPGTAQWLREKAKTNQDLAEGLLRAANRIERLQNELGKQKTGVDPSYMPMTPRGPAQTRPAPGLPTFRVAVPEDLHDKVFDWIDGSERLGMGLLDGAILVLDSKPEEGGEPATLKVLHTSRADRLQGAVALMHPNKGVELTDCSLLYVDTDDGTVIELVAKEAKDVGKEDGQDA